MYYLPMQHMLVRILGGNSHSRGIVTSRGSQALWLDWKHLFDRQPDIKPAPEKRENTSSSRVHQRDQGRRYQLASTGHRGAGGQSPRQPGTGMPDTAGAGHAVQMFVFALGVADFLDHICS